MPLRDMKEGFERVSMVAFVVVAAIFGAIYFVANSPYQPPAPDSKAGRAMQSDITHQCEPQQSTLLARLCRERIQAHYRWRYYVDKVGPGRIRVVVAVTAVIAGAFGIWAVGWIRKGFRSE